MPTVPKGFSGAGGAKYGVVVRNMPQVIAAIERAGDKFSRNVRLHANRIGIILVAEAHRLIKSGYYQPAWDTGTMFRSVGYTVKNTQVRVDIDFGVQVDYGIYVHEGTMWMAKRPFLMDAIKNKHEEIISELKKAFTLTGY
jgi:hypothetical protein